MKKFGSELIFISQIMRNGSGTMPIDDSTVPEFVRSDLFKITRLSIIEATYIASGFNTYVVKLKEV